jgi:REP element-mobilizing transposase RayT
VRRYGHNLPHWTADSATYFVTCRLQDSLPKHIVQQFEAEYLQVLACQEKMLGRKLKSEELKETARKLRNKIEKYLDSGHGACELAKPECAAIVKGALEFFDKDRYLLGAWAVMPNHAHVILKPTTHELDKIIKSWKSFTSREINKIVVRRGRLWQAEPFDHMLRGDAYLVKFSKYVLDNPKNAGLKDWQWTGVGSLGCGEEPV